MSSSMRPSASHSSSSTPSVNSLSEVDRLSGLDMVEDLIPEGKTVSARDLPDIIAQYEHLNSQIILSADERETLIELAGGMPLDMVVGSLEVAELLKQLIQKSTPTPTSTMESQPRNSRRTSSSFRIRSTSDSSTTDDSDVQSVREASLTAFNDDTEHKRTPTRNLSFPTPDSAGPFGNSKYPPLSYASPIDGSRRKHTTSDPNKPPTFQRGGTAPPSSFGRPQPPGRRSRRTSEGTMRDMDDGTPLRSTSVGSTSTPIANRPKPAGRPSHRRRSSALSAGGSVYSPDFIVVRSPISLLFGTEREGSPDLMGLEREGECDDDDDDDDDDDERNSGDETGRLHERRLARISTISTTSLKAKHDQMEALRKANVESLRKTQELQRQLDSVSSDNEQRIADLQEQLEEKNNELAIKRKEVKDLRIKENSQNIQLASREADMQTGQRALELSKESEAETKQAYQGQVAETERLRRTVLDRDYEIASQREIIEGHEGEKMQLAENIEALQAEILMIKTDLAIARQAEVELNRQKQENLSLKETISQLNYDIGQMRISGSVGHSRAATGSIAGTTSKNLGDEIARSLKASQEANVEVPGPVRTEYRTITYVTERFIENSDGTPGPPQMIKEEIVRDYADAGVSTDQPETRSVPIQTELSMTSMLPPYSPNPPTTMEEILEAAHPDLLASDENPDIIELETEYANLSMALGKRCHVIEKQIAKKQSQSLKAASLTGKAPSRRSAGPVTHTTEVVNMINLVVSSAATQERMWIIPTSLVVAALLGYFVGHRQGAPYFSAHQLGDALLRHDIKNIGWQQNHFIAGTWALKAMAGGAKQAVGRMPM